MSAAAARRRRAAVGLPPWLLAAVLTPAATLAAMAPPAAPTLSATLSPAEITVGDRVRVELEVTLPPGERWGPPTVDPGLHQWGEAELLAQRRPQQIPGEPRRYRLELLVTAFRPGKVSLPPIPVTVAPLRQEDPSPPAPLRFDTPPLAFSVRSVLPAQGQPTPQPPTPPQPLPAGTTFWWTVGGLALASLLAAGALLWRRRGLVAARPAAPPLSPMAQFLRDLAALGREPSPELVHTRLSLVLRQLLAALLGFPAVERTTSEIDRELRRGHLAAPTRRHLLDLLRRCDEVKFARRPASREDAQQRLATAREVGEEIQHELVPLAAPSGETAA